MFELMFAVVPIIGIGIFIFVLAMIFSPKLRAKMMGVHIKATKYMVDENKDNIESISTNLADATKTGTKTTVKAVAEGLREGFSDEETMFCKNCGTQIDIDSKFCKKCGKEQ